MERLRAADLRAVVTFLATLGAKTDIDTLPSRILAGLRDLIPNDLSSYNELDLRHNRASIVSDPEEALDPRQHEVFEHYLPEHPTATYHHRSGDGRAVKLSDFLSQRAYRGLGLYHDLYRRIGIEHLMGISLAPTPSGIIAIAITRGRRDFSERDRQVLDLVRPHLVQAYRNAEELRLIEQGAAAGRRELILLTPTGGVARASERARAWMATYFDAIGNAGAFLPNDLQRWVRAQRDHPGDEHLTRPSARLLVEREEWRLGIRFVASGPAGEHDLLLLEERRIQPSARALEALGLGRREAEVLARVARGETNEEIADRLSISERTVEKHLANVYGKLGVVTRTAAVAAAYCAVDPFD